MCIRDRCTYSASPTLVSVYELMSSVMMASFWHWQQCSLPGLITQCILTSTLYKMLVDTCVWKVPHCLLWRCNTRMRFSLVCMHFHERDANLKQYCLRICIACTHTLASCGGCINVRSHLGGSLNLCAFTPEFLLLLYSTSILACDMQTTAVVVNLACRW